MRILIMAGGKGVRLLPLTKYHPKILTSIHGKAFLHYILNLYKKHDVILSIGHQKEAIKDWCKENKVYVEYAEESEELGHSGAILNAQPLLSNVKMFAVVNGDTYHNIDIDDVKKGFLSDKEHMAMQIYATNKLTNKPDCSGIYILKQECFKYFRKGIHTDDILRCIPTTKVYLNNNYYLDIGTHAGLKLAKASKIL